MLARAFALLGALAAFGHATAEVAVPALTGRVVDLTGTLSAAQVQRLDSTLAAFEREKGTQIVVLLIPTTAGEPIESFGIRVAEQWKIGRKGIDDGVIVIVAKEDRAMRLEIGYGLEGVIPDAVAKRLIEDEFVPRFRQGDWFGGLSIGLERLMQRIAGEPLPAPAARERPPSGQALETYLVLFFLLVFVVGGLLRALLGRFGGAALIGGVAGFAAWLVIGSLLLALAVGVVAFVLNLFGGARAGWPARYGHGWGGGGFGGGLGGGGLRGGGGGFGGGGASGRW
ncbi:MAG TPA: TPM domain-containing protein [Burkholderiales bacterium]|nr:TPM domain-containing protein [Burkholderiales bacterium]